MREQSSFTFDLPEGERLKEQGIARAAANQISDLEIARSIAITIAKTRGTVTADDVQEELSHQGMNQLGPAAGALFRGDEWEFTGQWHKSRRTANHCHYYRVWRLR